MLLLFLTGLLLVFRAPNFLSFKGVPSPPFRLFRGYFHPLLIDLEGTSLCSVRPALHKTLVQKKKKKKHFEVVFEICLMHLAFHFTVTVILMSLISWCFEPSQPPGIISGLILE